MKVRMFSIHIRQISIQALWLLLVLYAIPSFSQTDSTETQSEKKKLNFKDPEDGAFDLSEFLLDGHGVLPILTPITEPAVGYGLGGALLYFHEKKKKYDSYVPPHTTGIAGLFTENGTWALGAFHRHTFGENRVRMTTTLLKPVLRYDFFGNNNPILENNPVGINLDSWFFSHKVLARLGKSRFYAGASYSFFNTDVTFFNIPDNPLIDEILNRLNTNSTISTIKPIINFDSRDNIFTPTKGLFAEVSLGYSAEWLGSDDEFSKLRTALFAYVPVTDRLLSAWRFEGAYLFGNAPFYNFPFLNLRGVPALRYQDEITLVGETEWTMNVYRRWSLLGFFGGGKAVPNLGSFNEEEWVYSLGTGFRYKIARLLGAHMGLDFAWGNGEDFAFYIVFGTSWL